MNFGKLYLDKDGDVCHDQGGHNLIFCPACGDHAENWEVLNPEYVKEIVRRFNAFPELIQMLHDAKLQMEYICETTPRATTYTYIDRINTLLSEMEK